MPLTLPDLPGIVDDEKFVLDLTSQSPIAPSSAAVTPTVRLDLPTPVSASEENNFPSEQSVPNLPNFSDNKISTSEVVSPPPPPLPSLNQSLEKQALSSQVQIQAPPPPPPPPPPPAPVEETKQSGTKQPSTLAPKASVTDDRTNLMAAIRDAGGIGRAKLRHTVPAEKANDRFSSASVGGDLMADLHAKLSMRRKGIAGSGMNALERISSKIPPPPPKPNEVSDRNSATSEGDSQPDNDEWEE